MADPVPDIPFNGEIAARGFKDIWSKIDTYKANQPPPKQNILEKLTSAFKRKGSGREALEAIVPDTFSSDFINTEYPTGSPQRLDAIDPELQLKKSKERKERIIKVLEKVDAIADRGESISNAKSDVIDAFGSLDQARNWAQTVVDKFKSDAKKGPMPKEYFTAKHILDIKEEPKYKTNPTPTPESPPIPATSDESAGPVAEASNNPSEPSSDSSTTEETTSPEATTETPQTVSEKKLSDKDKETIEAAIDAEKEASEKLNQALDKAIKDTDGEITSEIKDLLMKLTPDQRTAQIRRLRKLDKDNTSVSLEVRKKVTGIIDSDNKITNKRTKENLRKKLGKIKLKDAGSAALLAALIVTETVVKEATKSEQK